MAKGGIGDGNLTGGLSNHSPRAPVDEVAKPKGESVDAGATRSSTASTPKTLGPRTA